jgi:hypothetical protein
VLDQVGADLVNVGRGRHRDQRPADVMAGAGQLDPVPGLVADHDMVAATFLFEEVRPRQPERSSEVTTMVVGPVTLHMSVDLWVRYLR